MNDVKALELSLLKSARALEAEARYLRQFCRIPKPDALEHFAEVKAVSGAFLFHKWAASQLQMSVRARYGPRLVLGAHRLLKRKLANPSAFDHMFRTGIDSTVPVNCRLCSCDGDDGKRADCLIGRFSLALKRIGADEIAEWYSDLSANNATDVRAFFRVAALSDWRIRHAYDQVLSRQEFPAIVKVVGDPGNESEDLRNAFLCTAIQAAHEWTKIRISGNGGCRSRAAAKFDMTAGAVGKVWRRFENAHE